MTTNTNSTFTFVDCWPCDDCGTLIPVDVCSPECNELLAFCADCVEKDSAGWTIVRPESGKAFAFSDGLKGWWGEFSSG